MFHRGNKVKYVAFGLARETLKHILAEINMKGSVPFSIVDRTPTSQLVVAFSQISQLIMLDKILHRHSCLDCAELDPLFFHTHSSLVLWIGWSDKQVSCGSNLRINHSAR